MQSPTPEPEVPAASTPASIYLALLLMMLAVAAPFIGEYQVERSDGDSWQTLRIGLKWLSISVAAGIGGIVSTIVGARRGPCTVLTQVTIWLWVPMILAVLAFISVV
jgi:hypothetical protein